MSGMGFSILLCLLVLCDRGYCAHLTAAAGQTMAKVEVQNADTAEEFILEKGAKSDVQAGEIAEKSADVEQQHSLNMPRDLALSLVHLIQRRGLNDPPTGAGASGSKRPAPMPSGEKGATKQVKPDYDDIINKLRSWYQYENNRKEDVVTVPMNEFSDKQALEYFQTLSHFNLAFPMRYIVKFHLAGGLRAVTIGPAPYGTGQILVYGGEHMDRTSSYVDVIKDLLETSDKSVTDKEIAAMLLASLQTPLKAVDQNVWDRLTTKQQYAAVELIAITQIAEAVPPLPYVNCKSGRTPLMAEFAIQCLEQIKGGKCTFKQVFAAGDKSLYPAASKGGTDKAREAAKCENPCNIKCNQLSNIPLNRLSLT